ncbi:family 78 glycoside hydrolase catalytic domain [Actinacidiphila sp. bgisy145]|uniref:family 78 glycoside hydrolase catalytic domain n=1 Tax=Actinacidiphila sp. bgisy145 TaxID=3413792 RepID=UPI003EBCDC3B
METADIVRVEAPTVEHHREPVGIGESRPRLSWRTVTGQPGWMQGGYEIEVVGRDRTVDSRTPVCSAGPDGTPVPSDAVDHVLHRTGRMPGGQSVLVPWPGAPLRSRDRVDVRVRVWGSADETPSAWSAATTVETGLLERADWKACPITPDWNDPAGPLPVAMLRRDFTLHSPAVSARLYATAYGVYEMELNGEPVGDHVLAPGWTSYHHRLRYQTYNVTALLRPGRNTIGALLGEGWYTGRLGFGGGVRNRYGTRRALLAQLEVRHLDGSTTFVGTDRQWRTAEGPLLRSELYDGETYDARLERPGWSLPGHDLAGWQRVQDLPLPTAELVAPTGPPVRRTEIVRPVEVLRTPAGRTVLDFGCNLVGRLRVRVSGPAGHTVTLRHAEVLENGEPAYRPLRQAAATDRYTLRGGSETYEPRFTFHGFRYAEIEGWPGPLDPADIEAVVLHTDMRRTGWFSCSAPLVTRLHDNVVRGMRGNFLDIPTDCPQRDERLGWTGDIQVFGPTASFLYDCSGMLTGWLRDLAAEQFARPDRVPPLVVPEALPPGFGVGEMYAVWGDVAVLLPWTLYTRFGDKELLRAQYPSMTAWVDKVATLAEQGGGLWRQDFQFGDWLDPAAPADEPGSSRTDGDLVANAYLVRSADVLADVADLLGKRQDADAYRMLADRVRDSFCAEFATANGRLSSDTQTAYALAVRFALLPDVRRKESTGRRLAEIVRASGFRIATGFAGTPLICDALCDIGEPDLAYRMLLERGCPSWLYPVTMGATTVWERWDSILPDGTINPGEMTSFNHYALGAVADWMHRTVAGLAAAAPGWRRIRIAPIPGAGLTWARAAHETPYGRAEADWRLDGGTLTVTALIPPNTRAQVHLPDGQPPFYVGPGRHEFTLLHSPMP